MCGICGFMNLEGQPVDENVGQHMTNLLWHRGPDGSGSLIIQSWLVGSSPSIFLGHRRLRIIDLSEAAKQPMANEDGTIWVVFNGEIYNFLDLRNDLQHRGHVFHSRSDTETIVHAYEEFNDDFVKQLDGMFAFALWDGQHGRLILARDRSGKKPLFYSFDGVWFTFASEIKALLVCPWINRKIAVEHIPEYLTFGYIPTPRTLYAGILQVPPGSYVVVDKTGLKGPHRYWNLRFKEKREGNFLSLQEPLREQAKQVRELLIQAVARRLISDVPLGALLSGGLDSSIVVGIMSQLLKGPVHTFTIGFTDDLSYDERPYAVIAAKHFKTDHTEFVVQADAISLIELLLWHHDQPFGDSSAIPTYLLCKLARQHVTVALNGDGGDEVFAGYDRFLAALLAEKTPKCLARLGRAIACCLPNEDGYYSSRRRMERFFEQAHAPVNKRFIGWLSIFDAVTLTELLRPELKGTLSMERLYASINEFFTKADDLPLLHKLLYLNFMTYLPDDLHVKMDRMSMANSLETRSPMLDTALIEYVASLPPQSKIHWAQTRYILKLAFRDMLPSELFNRKKHGFGVPLNHWFRHQLRPYVEDTLLLTNARSNIYLDQNCIRTLYYEHVSGMREHGYKLWTLLNFELWLRMVEEGKFWKPQRFDAEEYVNLVEVKEWNRSHTKEQI